MRTAQKTVLTLLMIATLLSACSKADRPAKSDAYASEAVAQSVAVAEMSAPQQSVVLSEISQEANALTTPADNQALPAVAEPQDPLDNKPLVIKGELQFEVDNVQQTARYIQALVKSHSGYIASETIHNTKGQTETIAVGDGKVREITEYTPNASITVRVPNDQLPAFLQNLETRVAFLHHSTLNAKDASLEIQKSQLEQQIADLKAKSLDNISTTAQNAGAMHAQIAVAEQTALARLEALHAKLSEQAMQDEVAFATVQLFFSEHTKLHTRTIENLASRLAQEKRGHFGTRLKDNFAVGWSWAVESLLLITRLWVVGFVLIGLWLGKKLWKKQRERRAKKLSEKRPPIYVPAPKQDNP